MLGWIFKKKAAPVGENAAASKPAVRAIPAARSAPATPEAASLPEIDWPAQLQAAHGDDAALLALARAGAPLAVQQAAIDAVTHEAALKQAERDWRGHDRRLHRLVKQRYLAQVAQREARETATRLIDVATALQQETPIPTNRLVELDRDWRLLDTNLLEPAQTEAYAALLAQLTTLTRERGDQALKVQRWTGEARGALVRMQRALAEVAAGAPAAEALTEADAAARALAEAAPDTDATRTLRGALIGAVNTCEQLGVRLGLLDELLQAPPAAAADLLARWDASTPLADAQLADALNQRVASWRAARDADQQTRRSAQRAQARERQREAGHELVDALAVALDQGDTALAAGHLADTHRQLVAVDELLNGHAPPAALAARIDRLQAEYARLKGWQHWGGGLARDELVLQAEALAAVSQREPEARGLKLSVRQQAEVIDDMRARWKELDRLGGATSRALWQRFDAALKAAYQPVAEHQAQQRAVRTQNLQSRLALIEALNSVGLAEADPVDSNASATAPDWRALAGALDHFRTEWRKLGPLEHTVPHKARDELVQRMDTATARLDAPLLEARRLAQLGRERLITRARTLADEARAGTAGRDSIDKVRELQAEWQQHAKTLPLARAVETALWSDFKAAVDAVFGAREAAFSARDAQFKAGSTERAALIEQLEAVPADAPPADFKRTLAEVDAAWQRAAPPLRQDAAGLDAHYRRLRDALRERITGHARRQWQATCDSLSAKLALCVEQEAQADPAAARADLSRRWSAHSPLPPAWEQALAHRAALDGSPQRGAARTAAATDDLLLQLEMAFELATPAAHQAARRDLKLQAMKAALEGRPAAKAAPLTPGQALAVLLGRAALDASQGDRLAAVVSALRQRDPIDAS